MTAYDARDEEEHVAKARIGPYFLVNGKETIARRSFEGTFRLRTGGGGGGGGFFFLFSCCAMETVPH